FDTIYHEHMSYHTIRPLTYFFRDRGMKIIDVERLPNHGGSIRVFVALKDSTHVIAPSVKHIYDSERNILDKVGTMHKKINDLSNRLKDLLHDIHVMGHKVAI